ncbi:ankyrin repeat-containing domain protein [Baffinella frigidus]|nr:ankyrin repeat-containing domain protein [Cryptophyta sp. CCMP2293]
MLPTLWSAASQGRSEEVHKLLAAGADFEEKGGTWEFSPLHEASFQGHDAVVGLLLEARADVSSTDIEGGTALHLAAWVGHAEVAELLLEHGADRWTPLHFAVSRGHESMARLLLDKGADVSAKNHSGWTPLHVAGHSSPSFTHFAQAVVRLLLDKGADVAARTTCGVMPLHSAAFGGHEAYTLNLKPETLTPTPEPRAPEP